VTGKLSVQKEVLIIGGGYGGLRAAEKLCEEKNIHVTLVDKNHYHYLQTEMYEFVSGRLNICDITYNLKRFGDKFSNFTFVCDEALELDVVNKKLLTRNASFVFDSLIIAVGTQDFIPQQLQKYAYVVKDLTSAFALKRSFLQKLYEEVTTASAPVNVVIGGAGQSGVELAADFVSYAQECSHEAGYSCGVNVTLIEGGDTILPGSDPYIQKHTYKRLKELGTTMILNTFIESVDEKMVQMKDKQIPYDIFVFSGGTQSVPFIDNLEFKKNKENLLVPNEYLELSKDIYCIGDCAYIVDKNGDRLSPTAQIAEQSAEYVAQSILKGKQKSFEGKIYGMFTALGSHYAVGHIFHKVYLKGVVAYFIKAAITKLYAYGIKTKVNSAFFKR